MATGRMLSKMVSEDRRMADIANNLGCEAALFLTWCFPHLDRDGRIIGDPMTLIGRVCPRVKKITPNLVTKTLELAATTSPPIVIWYEDKRDQYIEFCDFRASQKNLRYDREPESLYPTYSEETCRALPESIRQTTGNDPVDGRPNISEANLNKPNITQYKGKTAKAVADDLGDVWNTYLSYHETSKLDKTRKDLITEAIEVSSKEMAIKAIHGLHKSEHHLGQNDRRTKYLGIKYAFTEMVGGIRKVTAAAIEGMAEMTIPVKKKSQSKFRDVTERAMEWARIEDEKDEQIERDKQNEKATIRSLNE